MSGLTYDTSPCQPTGLIAETASAACPGTLHTGSPCCCTGVSLDGGGGFAGARVTCRPDMESPQIYIRSEGTSEAAPEAVRQAVGGGCQSGWGQLLSVTNAIDTGTWGQGDSGWA